MKLYKNNEICLSGLLILISAAVTGCVVTGSDTHYSGVERSDLKQIVCGSTTREELVSIVGEPTEQSMTEEGTEVLKYQCSEKKNSNFVLFPPPIVIEDKKEKEYIVAFELKDGIVQRHWKEK